MAPRRIQLSRAKGYRKPAGAIVVARPSRWGNIYVVGAGQLGWSGFVLGGVAGHYDANDERLCDQPLPGERGLTAELAVAFYRYDLEGTIIDADKDPFYAEIRDALGELRGHDLACWCPLDAPCHADVLLELANA